MAERGHLASADRGVYRPPPCPTADAGAGAEAARLACFAPVFEIAEGARELNRIGTPRIRLRRGRERVDVDADRPTLFAETRKDCICGRDVIHLVYRIHFTKLPFTTAVFFERHRNAGLLTLVTLDAASGEPLFLTTVYTCGCYRALIPTEAFPRHALPERWPAHAMKVFGKTLPSVVSCARAGESRWVIALASRTHRVEAIRIAPEPADGIAIPLAPIDDLRRLPVEGAPGRTSSFFHTRGFLKGHVRGAWSPIEGLTAGLLLLDPLLGMDKDFGDAELTGTRFYTGLLPWQREVSRLDRFEPLLKSLSFRLDALGTAGAVGTVGALHRPPRH